MKKIRTHIFFWLPLFIAAYTIDSIVDPYMTFGLEVIFFLSQNIFLFYSILYSLKKFSVKSKLTIVVGIGRIILLIAAFICLRYWIRYYLLTNFFAKEFGEWPVENWFPTCFNWIINSFFYASAYFYFQSSIQKQKALLKSQEERLTQEKEAIQLEKEKIKLEKENLQLENTALRAQINPHFLYNTLDFLYAKALPVSDELSDGVMKLSDIMRYSLKPQDAEGLVYLADEAEHIQNIIEMNQLRFNNKLNVVFTTEDTIPDDVKIIPLVLITLVENVFKHGVTNSAEHPAVITLQRNENDRLLFKTSNKKRIGPKEHSTGIGLNNTLKRLKNTYGDLCTVTVADDAEHFAVAVEIQLLKNELFLTALPN